ncbi:MAG TPA: YihY/virulence factor BrkB family protein [Acidimicrobiales bacterium]|nr:YihY/virulence factor BrkB family protein [Acidimicrobiales bacterium]
MVERAGGNDPGMVLGINSRANTRPGRSADQAKGTGRAQTAQHLASPEAATQGEAAARPGPPLPGSPARITASGWRATAKRTLAEVKKDNVTMVAGSLAYNAFMSVFPTLIALIGFSALINMGSRTVTSLVKGIGKALPPGASGVLTTAVKAAQHRTGGALAVTIIAVLVAAWSASGGMATVETGLDVAYELGQNRKFIAKRLVAMELLVVVLLLGGLASALIVFGQPVGTGISNGLGINGPVFDAIWTLVRWVAGFAVMSILFSLIYRIAPDRKQPQWKWFTPGGIIGTAIWLVASLALSFYVSSLGSYGKTYGALAGVAVFLLWFYVSGLALLVGAELNAELERQATIDLTGQRRGAAQLGQQRGPGGAAQPA